MVLPFAFLSFELSRLNTGGNGEWLGMAGQMSKVCRASALIFAIGIILSGCASLPLIPGRTGQESVLIEGTRYISLTDLSESYQLSCLWDPIAKKTVLSKEGDEARVLVESTTVLLNDRVYTMPKEARFYNAQVYIPQSFALKTLIPLFRKQALKTKIFLPQKDAAIKSVIIDPGHGGKDPGAVGRGGLKEKDVVLDIAKRLKRKLNAMGIEVILTRDCDKFISLSQRSRIANSYAEKADFFISIHANASYSRRVSGVEVFYISESIDDARRAQSAARDYNLGLKEDYCGKYTPAILWDLILSENRRNSIDLAQLVCAALSKNLAQRNRGKKPARFYVLKGTNLPAILVEVGFISNPADEKKLCTNYYRDKIASSITEGLKEYNRSYQKAIRAGF